MLRRLISLSVGFAVVFLVVVLANNLLLVRVLGLDWQSPSGLEMAAMALVGLLAGGTGGAVTASLAPDRPLGHVALLAAVNLALSLAAVLTGSPPQGQPVWFVWSMTVLAGVSVMIGGFVADRL